MNHITRMILQEKLKNRDSRSRDGAYANDNARGRNNDRERDRAMFDGYRDGFQDGYDRAKYEIRGEYDKESDGARRRSSTTGRYIRDRSEIRLEPDDFMHWKKLLKNADGGKGERFEMNEIMDVAKKMGIRFDGYSEKEFCMTMNMLYSDFCEVFRSLISPEKEAHFYAKFAQAWLEDEDGPPPSEKLALYYHCIVDNE